jgi:hypothetical protein
MGATPASSSTSSWKENPDNTYMSKHLLSGI